MIVLSVDPYTAYKGQANGMTHYYYQNETGVVHINRSHPLMNHLPREHLVVTQTDVEEVSVEEYMDAAAEVLLHLGFPMSRVEVDHQSRQN